MNNKSTSSYFRNFNFFNKDQLINFFRDLRNIYYFTTSYLRIYFAQKVPMIMLSFKSDHMEINFEIFAINTYFYVSQS